MKNTVKRAIALALALVMILALSACGSAKPASTTAAPQSTEQAAEQTVSFKKTKIGVALYHDSGYYTENVRTYLGALGKAMNVEFIYTVLTQTDESVNLTKIQELIAAGAEGIILTLDMGTPTILSECASANVYVAGFLCDFNTSYNTSYGEVFKNPTFLGTASDGPLQQIFVQQFTEKIEEYNKTADKPITLDPLDEAVDVLPFIPLDSTYFAKHDGIDAIFCFADGFTFVYPTMVSSGINGRIKLFCAGYGAGSDENFGSKGNTTFQQEAVSAIEAVVYPVVMLVNKLNGVSFPDQPAEAERRSCFSMIINSDEDMDAFVNHSFYITGKMENALYSPEQVVNMTAVANPNATYADLVSILNHMTMDDIIK